jgi:hypothetical protein
MARKPWLSTDLEDWNLDTKSIGHPGRRLSARPTIWFHKINAVTETRTRKNLTQLGRSEYQQTYASMNDVSESHTEADNMKSILNTRTKLKIGCWNVRTMYETGKQAQVIREMRAYKLHLLGISECRWTGCGKRITSTGETIVYSGRNDEKHHGGVAIIMNRNVTKAMLEYAPVNERIIRARFQAKQGKLTIIQCYAPTNEADDEEKTDFYLALQSEIEKVPTHDVTIVMGDLNAKVGNDNTGNERVMGKYGCGNINDNGERLVDLCGTNNLVIGGTFFPHREIHKLTWISPNGRDKNQIDHIIINGK